MHAHMCVRAHVFARMRVHACLCVHCVHVCVCMSVCTRVCACQWVCACVCMHASACMPVCTCAHVPVCACPCVHMQPLCAVHSGKVMLGLYLCPPQGSPPQPLLRKVPMNLLSKTAQLAEATLLAPGAHSQHRHRPESLWSRGGGGLQTPQLKPFALWPRKAKQDR